MFAMPGITNVSTAGTLQFRRPKLFLHCLGETQWARGTPALLTDMKQRNGRLQVDFLAPWTNGRLGRIEIHPTCVDVAGLATLLG